MMVMLGTSRVIAVSLLFFRVGAVQWAVAGEGVGEGVAVTARRRER